jgi:hypothetical protein
MEYRRWKYGEAFRRIYLGEGEWTILDHEDYYRLGNFKWHIKGNGKKFYVVRSAKNGSGRTKLLSLHREITNAPKGLVVDHRNRNTLDNRRANLRLATASQNMHNVQKKKNASSRFFGVYFIKNSGRWGAQIRFNGKDIWLGTFVNEIDAAMAYDAAAKKYYGEFARLNFPEETSNILR